jgi:hypothetical protein
MATYFVRSGAGGANDGSSWANAFTSLVTAVAAPRTAGDTFYVADDHLEQTASLTLAPAGTYTSPQIILCVTNGSTPTAADIVDAYGGLTTCAILQSTTTTNLTINGVAHWQGIKFIGGASGASGGQISFGGSGKSTFENCSFQIVPTGTTSIRPAASTVTRTVWKRCSVKLAANTQSIGSGGGQFDWFGGKLETGSLTNSNGLFTTSALRVEGVDFTEITLANYELGTGYQLAFDQILRGCALSSNTASVKVYEGAPNGDCSEITLAHTHNSGNYNHEKWMYVGKQQIETTIIRTGGSSDGTQGVAWKITTTANCKFHRPFKSLPIVGFHDAEDSAITVTVEGVWTGGVLPKNDEIWMEVQYFGDGTTPLFSTASDGKATVLTTSADQTTSSETWGGGTTKFKLECTFTPAQKGEFAAHIYVGAASATVYIDPMVIVS